MDGESPSTSYIRGPAPHLEKDEELEDAAERGWEEARIRYSHLEEKGMEEAIAHINQGVLVEVRVPYPPVVSTSGPTTPVVVHWVMVIVRIGLILRHPDPLGVGERQWERLLSSREEGAREENSGGRSVPSSLALLVGWEEREGKRQLCLSGGSFYPLKV